jgi:exopolyphosphatase/guanosine-5'-triphosphate,3'-diphosphate pyrophosphatase
MSAVQANGIVLREPSTAMVDTGSLHSPQYRSRPEQRSGVIDIGSNTIRLLVAQLTENELRPVANKSVFVGLGREVARSGRLPADVRKRALKVIASHRLQARAERVDMPLALATSAVRDAENRDQFIREVEERAEVPVRVLSGEEEAWLTFLGVQTSLALRGENVIVDLGGGSAEVICAHDQTMRWARSLDLGCARLTERFVTHHPPTRREVERLVRHVADRLESLPALTPSRLVLTGGTASALARLTGHAAFPAQITHRELLRAEDIVRQQPTRRLARHFGVKVRRADLLAAGIITIRALADHVGCEQILATKHSLREGAILETACA